MSDTNGMKAGSNLEKVFRAGHFAVTCECGPPKGADVEHLKKKVNIIKGYVDAANVTDNQTAVVRMSSIGASAILVQNGIEPIMQMVTRDRNRIAAQSDVFGAYALGIRNMLCLSGDHQKFGNHPFAKNVFDIDSIQLLDMMRVLRDEGKMNCGEEVEGGIKMFFGAAANPFADPYEFRVIRMAKKIMAGADFIQTQCIYDMKRFKEFMKMACDMGLDKKCFIMAGLTPLKSAGMANYMNKRVSGITIPDEIIQRIKGVPKDQQAEEGIKLLIEQIEEVKEIPGIAGVHVMAIEWEEKIPEIMERAKLLPRPQV
ncbi:methylenetetrahydrofolate reductase [Desulforhabdus amnigena]|uniref:Methylenetetrahydrofolate reductase n=1 Tax=Desulforhabdus amnigena TaxID=40218 RepID=A0A9W6LAL1_9BACT|nr:methylenetetrahydrofolate reductase [Desulforhabdus amnigena]GLI36314.1 methylenetetrahydrofolate reductase [Desulforhabdus amnigena]